MKVNVAHFLLAAAAETGHVCWILPSAAVCGQETTARPRRREEGGGRRLETEKGAFGTFNCGEILVAMATGSKPQRVY